MGMGSASGGGRSASGRYGRRGRKSVSDINITPLVDVMLVLLIVFMVAAPMLTIGVPVNLPKTSAKPLASTQDKPISLSVTKSGEIFIGKISVDLEGVSEKIMAILAAKGKDHQEKIFIRADHDVDYGKVLEVMAALSSAGLHKISLISDRKDHE